MKSTVELARRRLNISQSPLALRALVWILQLAIFAASGCAAFLLRFDLHLPAAITWQFRVALAVWVILKAAVFRLARQDRGWWIYFSSHDVLRLCRTSALASAASGMVIVLLLSPGFPRSVHIIDFILCTLLLGSIRFTVRMAADRRRSRIYQGARIRALIYGAGAAGQALHREILTDSRLPYEVLGFIDDDATKNGMQFQGVRVFGPGSSLASVVRTKDIAELLIAVPAASSQQRSRILRRCHEAEVRCKTIPSFAEIISGAHHPATIRDVAVEDLLGRPPNHLDENRIRRQVEGEVVLVTGAAGSIGSELCRQLARLAPRTIVGFDIAESGLFHLDREMRETYPDIQFRPEVGSIQNRARLHEMMTRHSPSAVYHAAAYKHVPLMEAHAFEAVENNVFGTCELVVASASHGVRTFVMISSDKAVRPTNVMGASKRLAEMVVHAMESQSTRFVSVRFGNVLGSNGSVVPIFKEQIAAGGPVRVTHPEMRRYFMTIPEAVQLVLQASTKGRGGEVFLLDMGEPVKIVDLARNLIRLSGLRPDEDIRIEFTGIRPGEKLYEELSRSEEMTITTAHEKIKIFAGTNPSWSELTPGLESLRALCQSRDVGRLILQIQELVPEYHPDPRLLKQCLPSGQFQDTHHQPEQESLSRLMAQVGHSVLAFEAGPETVPQA